MAVARGRTTARASAARETPQDQEREKVKKEEKNGRWGNGGGQTRWLWRAR